jgi:hypothetical protein
MIDFLRRLFKRECFHSVTINSNMRGSIYCEKCGIRVGSVSWE